MAGIARVGISLDETLLAAFDALCTKRGYANRSEAIRDLIRKELVQTEWTTGTRPTVGALCLVYEHDRREVDRRLTRAQHEHRALVVSTLHVHLDAHNCLEVLILRGKAADIQAFSDSLISTKGVKHGELVQATTGAALD
jgi:CopG family nickel-responsive transcriptional regulator